MVKIAALLLLCFTQLASANPASKKDLMATVGESISAGFLADWRAAPATTEDLSDQLLLPVDQTYIDEDLNDLSFPSHPRHGIGPRRLRMGQIFNEKYTLSWSSGMSIQSHYQRARRHLKLHEPSMDLEIYNVAMSGSVAADLPWQAQKIVDEWNRELYRKVSCITVTIGANDVCAEWTPGGNTDNEIRFYVRQFFKTLTKIKQSEPIRIFISAIPRIPDLGQPEILQHYLTEDLSCEYRMKVRDQYCNSLIDWKTPEEYRSKVKLVAQKNYVLEKLVGEANQIPQLAAAFGKSLFNRKIRLSMLSKDCYHPNRNGQEEIADQMWKEQPWFR